jgi:hypothetical protein
MMKMRWIAAVAASLAAGCAPAVRSAPPPAEAPDAAVYAAALDSLAGGKPIVLLDSLVVTTEGGRMYDDLRQTAGAEIAADLLRRGGAPRAVPAPLPTRSAVRFVQRRELPSGTGDLEAEWRAFNARHPGSSGYFQVSAVGYDRGGTRAVLYVGHSCGSLCGTGSIVTLARAGNGWRIVESRMLWIS